MYRQIKGIINTNSILDNNRDCKSWHHCSSFLLSYYRLCILRVNKAYVCFLQIAQPMGVIYILQSSKILVTKSRGIQFNMKMLLPQLNSVFLIFSLKGRQDAPQSTAIIFQTIKARRLMACVINCFRYKCHLDIKLYHRLPLANQLW